MSINKELIPLANGEKVPQACVDALDDFENDWPGASQRKARYGITFHVLKAAVESGHYVKVKGS